MDPHEIVVVVSAFTIAQRQMFLILEALLHDNKHITHIPTDVRHKIRQLTVDLESTEHVDVEEMVALFLHVLAHGVKNRQIQREFVRSSKTVSRHFNMVLMIVLRLHDELLATPQPIMSGCIDMSGSISRVALGHLTAHTPKLTWYYYLCDTDPNAKGFLALYRGRRYHLQEWRGVKNALETSKFNIKYSSARNVIKRAFSLFKGRWAILRRKSYYPVQVQCRTIMACCLLYNLINWKMNYIDELDDEDDGDSTHATTRGDEITYIEPSNEWTEWRDTLASMTISFRSPKHSWTHAEEACLVDCLVDLVNVESGGRTTGPSSLVVALAGTMTSSASSPRGTCSIIGSSERTPEQVILILRRTVIRVRERSSHEGPCRDLCRHRFERVDRQQSVPIEDGIDMEFSAMCSPRMNMSPEDMMGDRSSRSSNGRTGSSRQKRKRSM
ncbi:retrotransposon protein [Cucumis melo var. makuwa]|uniref:Retrotransposon protein n=1 Tax=Cucumis melo var. makuwa TaxID=1194695 RepID=A0A5D3DV28_CUCMM|nr:retrotransposon protein [Cucumis melo var. makuwa]TYK27219.1 retrotransposon protein [Cucumis melo var. makuwa]